MKTISTTRAEWHIRDCFALLLALIFIVSVFSPLCVYAEGEDSSAPESPPGATVETVPGGNSPGNSPTSDSGSDSGSGSDTGSESSSSDGSGKGYVDTWYPIYAEYTGEDRTGVIDSAVLDERIEAYLDEHKLNKERFSVGYCYLETGDEYMWNGDVWMYSASLYKVPLMMLFAQQEYAGEITQESTFSGYSLEKLETGALIYSNNELAHIAMHALGNDADVRIQYRQFAGLDDEYYDDNRFNYSSYFTARFMTRVMKTLYNEEEQFPRIIDCLKQAQPDHYFRVTEGQYEIAQKYGSYNQYQHAAGIIYAPAPLIAVVMTTYTGNFQQVIADLGAILTDYTVELQAQLAESAETAGTADTAGAGSMGSPSSNAESFNNTVSISDEFGTNQGAQEFNPGTTSGGVLSEPGAEGGASAGNSDLELASSGTDTEISYTAAPDSEGINESAEAESGFNIRRIAAISGIILGLAAFLLLIFTLIAVSKKGTHAR